jgi:hypothetical protein
MIAPQGRRCEWLSTLRSPDPSKLFFEVGRRPLNVDVCRGAEVLDYLERLRDGADAARRALLATRRPTPG